jgi:ribonucleotide reductase beta subunit family protein with ferritin-like domain
MSARLIEIFKKNSQDLEELKKEVYEIKKKIESLETETKEYSGEIKNIGQQSIYIEKYLENIQNQEIEELLNDEEFNFTLDEPIKILDEPIKILDEPINNEL